MRVFIPNEKHIEIINEIGRFKVIALKNLFEQVGQDVLYSPFCARMRRLEKEGVVRSFLGTRKRKFFTLSQEGEKLSKYPAVYSSTESLRELNHDIISSFVLSELLKFQNFKAGHVTLNDVDIIPDAVIYGEKNSIDYALALEIELHQKSRKRVVNKYSDYYKSKNYDYVMYITNKMSLYESYLKTLKSMTENVQKSVILLCDENLCSSKFDFINSKMWFKQSEKQFREVFE